MKKLLLISILFFLSTFSIIAQSPCPTISITAPNTPTKIGDLMTFTAKIDGISFENLKYKWVVSNGEIANGQGTLTINVATIKEMGGQTVTATIEVSGLPQNCSNSFSSSGEIEASLCCSDPGKFDEYKNISWLNEKKKLDAVAKTLKDEQGMMIIFRLNIKEKKYSKTFKTRKEQIEKYLIQKHKLPQNRIKVIMGGNNENRTEVWFMPIGVFIPS